MVGCSMAYDPAQRARTILSYMGSPLLVGALASYPRSVGSLRVENRIVPSVALAIMLAAAGIGLESHGVARAGAFGLLSACIALTFAGVAIHALTHERIFAAWTVFEGLRRGWLAAEADGVLIRLIERNGETYATLLASHPSAPFILAGYGGVAVAERRAA